MKRQLSILLNLFLLLALTACGTVRQPSRLPDPEEVKALLVQLVDEKKVAPGIVVGMIAADPDERWVVGYGRLSADDDRVPDGDTVFEIASVTKVFTGTMLAQAVLNGEVHLDDPISMYLPEGVTAPEYEGRAITLLDLATHTSGLPREPSNLYPRDLNNPRADYTMDQMYDFLSGYHLPRAPGSTYEYSNYGFGLLGNLLVRVAGQADYEALLEERITGPLGMDSTRIELTPDMRARLAVPHCTYSVETSLWKDPTLTGAGAIRSTANDMLTFLAANMGLAGTELQPALQLANTPQRPGEALAYIGLGWNVPGSGNGIHYHGGGHPGYTSFLGWDSERKIGLVVLMNIGDGPSNYLAYQLLRGMPKPFPVDPQVLAEYAGRYQFIGDFSDIFVTIRVDGNHIFFQLPNQPDNELVARSDNQFYLDDVDITFYRNASGEVDRLVVTRFGESLEAMKVP